jgi:hypothetical protein
VSRPNPATLSVSAAAGYGRRQPCQSLQRPCRKAAAFDDRQKRPAHTLPAAAAALLRRPADQPGTPPWRRPFHCFLARRRSVSNIRKDGGRQLLSAAAPSRHYHGRWRSRRTFVHIHLTFRKVTRPTEHGGRHGEPILQENAYLTTFPASESDERRQWYVEEVKGYPTPSAAAIYVKY